MPPSIRAVLILLCMEPLFTVLAQDDQGDVQLSETATELPYTTDLTSERGLSLCGMTAYNYQGNCCYSIGPQTNYAGAREKCLNYKGHLIKLVPPEIYTRLQEIYSPDPVPDSWIGLAKDGNNAGIYIWDLDGTQVMMTNWDTMEPMLDCVYIDGSTGKWRTASCDELFDAICCVPEEDFVDPTLPAPTTDCMDEFGCFGDYVGCNEDGCFCLEGYVFIDEDETECGEAPSADYDIETTVPVATTDDSSDYDIETTVPAVTTEKPVSVVSVSTQRHDTTMAGEDTTVEGTAGTTEEVTEDYCELYMCTGDNIDCIEDGCVCHEGYEMSEENGQIFCISDSSQPSPGGNDNDCFEQFGCHGENIDCDPDDGCICDDGHEFTDDTQTECEDSSQPSPGGNDNDCFEQFGCHGENIDCDPDDGCICDDGHEFTDDTQTECEESSQPSPGSNDNDCFEQFGCHGENIDCDPDDGCICDDGHEFTDDTQTECEDSSQPSPGGNDNDCLEQFGCHGENIDCDPDDGCICDDGFEFTDDTQTECEDSSQPISPGGNDNDCFEQFECHGENIDCDPDDGCICDDGHEFTDDTQTECEEASSSLSSTSNDCFEDFGCEGDNIDCVPQEGCVCDEGNEFTDDTQTECEDVNECARGLHNCRISENYECRNEDGGFSCECRDGFTEQDGTCVQLLADVCTPQDNTCDEPTERCTNHNGVFICNCAPGFQRNPSTLVCENINECELSSSDPCALLTHTQCVDLNPGQSNGLFRCDCKENYMPDPARPGNCIRASDEILCQRLNCQNGGTCSVDVFTDDNVAMSCSCTDDFVGETCGTPRNLEEGIGTPGELNQGLMIGAIATGAALLALLVSCCCLCACLPFCRPPKASPPPPRPAARPWSYRRPYVVHRDMEHWFLERRYDAEAHEVYDEPVEEIREVLRPVEEEREEWQLERSEIDDEQSTREEQRMGFFRRAMDRATRNPLSSHGNMGYQREEGRGSDRSEMATPYMADGSLNA